MGPMKVNGSIPAEPPSPEEVEARMLELIESAELPPPDEVLHEEAEQELHFVWHDQKFVAIVELSD